MQPVNLVQTGAQQPAMRLDLREKFSPRRRNICRERMFDFGGIQSAILSRQSSESICIHQVHNSRGSQRLFFSQRASQLSLHVGILLGPDRLRRAIAVNQPQGIDQRPRLRRRTRITGSRHRARQSYSQDRTDKDDSQTHDQTLQVIAMLPNVATVARPWGRRLKGHPFGSPTQALASLAT